MQGALRAVEKKQLPHMLCVTNMLLHGIEDPSFVRHDNTLARPYISYTQSDRVDIVLTNPPFGGREEDGIESNFPQHFRTRETADLFLALIVRLLKKDGRAAVVLPDGTLFGEGVKTRLKEHLMEECNLHTIVRLPNSVFKPYASIGTNLLFFEKGAPTRDIWFYEHRVPEGQKAYSMTKPIRVEHLQGCVDWWGGKERKGREETPQAWRVTAEEVKARGYNLDVKNPHSIADDHGDPEELLASLRAAEAETASFAGAVKGDPRRGAGSMNSDGLLKHYERIADAPDAIARLRRFILDLAVRGKLAPQGPNDEPASELLKRIAAERADLVKQRVIRREEPLAPIRPSELPFDIPNRWIWSRIGNAFLFTQYGTSQKSHPSEKGVPVLGMGNIQDGSVVWDNEKKIPDTSEELPSLFLKKFDLLYNRTNSAELVGKTGIYLGEDGLRTFASYLIRLRPSVGSTDPRFLNMAMNAPEFRETQVVPLIKKQTGQANVNGTALKNMLIPLPPLAEQHRIVAKVDELMALCDRLEAARAEREATRDRLAAASLTRLNAPDPATFHDDARFALDALPALTTRPDQIKHLRQTILNLAVRGKLVPQDPEDEPASVLLKQIAKQKVRVRRAAQEGDVAAHEASDGYDLGFDLPTGWDWVRLEDITQIGTGLTPSKTQLNYYEGGSIPWINSSATSADVIREAKFFVTQLAVKECRLKLYPAGSLVVALYGQGKTRGQVAELGLDATVNQACAVVQWLPSFGDLKPFIRLTLEQQYEAMRERAEGGPQPNLNVGKIKGRLFPLPPLAEQHRIVAKVDALMALCDRLEASLTATAATRRRLLDALLAEALAPMVDRTMQAAE
jgi:type I restriction enzyme S subunit